LSNRVAELVGYKVAPTILQSWFTINSLSLVTFATEAAQRLANFNVQRVARANIRPSDIGLVAMEEPDSGEHRGMDFLAFCSILFYEFLGVPRPTAYVKCLLFLSDEADSSMLLYSRFTVDSPSHFLVAAGDFAALGAQMRTEVPGTARIVLEEKLVKRMDHRTQEYGGERTTTEGEKSGGYCIVTRDGIRLPTRDKSNLQLRCDQLEFMWRAADRGLWKHIAGSGYKLQAERKKRLWNSLQDLYL
jgi:hypothetical protein